MSGHQRDFGARQKFLHLLQKFQARHVRHHHVAENHVHRLLFEQGQRRFAAFRFQADETQGLAHGDAEFADALLVVDDQQADAEILFRLALYSPGLPHGFLDSRDQLLHAERLLHAGRAGLAQRGDRFLVGESPVMKTTCQARSGRLAEIQACTWPPSTPPGVRMSDTTPRNRPFPAGAALRRRTRSTRRDIRCAPERRSPEP